MTTQTVSPLPALQGILAGWRLVSHLRDSELIDAAQYDRRLEAMRAIASEHGVLREFRAEISREVAGDRWSSWRERA